MSIKLSIIIVSYNTKGLLLDCLDSLYAKSSYSNNFEVIVVDNGSLDGSCEMVAKDFPQVILLKNPANLGFGQANNLGAKYASGEYILLLNSDTIAACDLVEETLSFFKNHRDNQNAFGGLLLNADGSEQRGSRRSFPTFLNALLHFSKLSKIIKYKKSYDLSWLPLETHEVECVSGACVGMPKAMYEALGGFDELFFLHFEDIDLCKRIIKAGYKLWFYPQIRVFHYKGGSSNVDQSIRLNVNQWFLDSLAKYLWKWNKISAVVFSPIVASLRLAAWLKTL